jgi:hypothetical protein
MQEVEAMVTMSPQLGALLIKVTETPDIETALWKVLLEYLEFKSRALKEQITALEQKWGMSFDDFSQRCAEESLGKDVYSYEVERDFWEWERAVTLRRHYEALRAQWM